MFVEMGMDQEDGLSLFIQKKGASLDLEAIRAWTAMGNDINALSPSGSVSFLMRATEAANIDTPAGKALFSQLLAMSDPNTVDRQGDTALIIAAKFSAKDPNRVSILDKLSMLASDPRMAVDHRGEHGTAMEILCLMANAEGVKRIIERADIALKSPKGRTLLEAALGRPSPEENPVADILRERMAELDRQAIAKEAPPIRRKPKVDSSDGAGPSSGAPRI